MGIPIYLWKCKMPAVVDCTSESDTFTHLRFIHEWPTIRETIDYSERDKIEKTIKELWVIERTKRVVNGLNNKWNIYFWIGAIFPNLKIPIFYLESFWEKDWVYYNRKITWWWRFINQSFTISWFLFYCGGLGNIIEDIYYWYGFSEKGGWCIWIIGVIWIILFVRYFLSQE